MREDGGQRREDRGISNPSTVLRTGIEQGMTNYEGKKEVNGYQIIRIAGYQVKEQKTEVRRQSAEERGEKKERAGRVSGCQPLRQM
jgi:hypothetical protein